MPVFKNRVNDRHGRLVVLSHAGKDKRNKHLWLCKCDCGKEKIVVSCNLSSGKSKSCGCLLSEFLHKSGNQYGLYLDREDAILKIQFNHLKRRHKKFSGNLFSYQRFKELSLSACTYCGVSHSKVLEDTSCETLTHKRLSTTVLKVNGIDRVNSSIGYTVGNTVPCCKTCNTAKHLMSELDFYKWVVRVYEYNNLGSCGVAAAKLGRSFIGIETDATYFELAESSIALAQTKLS